jgi:hypothetical protein
MQPFMPDLYTHPAICCFIVAAGSTPSPRINLFAANSQRTAAGMPLSTLHLHTPLSAAVFASAAGRTHLRINQAAGAAYAANSQHTAACLPLSMLHLYGLPTAVVLILLQGAPRPHQPGSRCSNSACDPVINQPITRFTSERENPGREPLPHQIK